MTRHTKKLLERHPPAAKNRRLPPVRSLSDICTQISEEEVKHAVKSFPLGSTGGQDSLHPQHRADLVSFKDNDSSLLTVFTAFFQYVVERSMR